MRNDAEPLPRACRAVEASALEAGLEISIRIMDQSTRTAEEAAAACGCAVGQIVKSLVFRGRDTAEPILLLVSGSNRVKENLVARAVGEKIDRPDADFVREVTGFAIGGIPPLGHARKMRTYLDADLLTHDRVFAAAGTPNAIFEAEPARLAQACGAAVIAVHD
jgi:prolyl-tRNA editing enzyme YbaK/EbsC (Cys-tRNA(Pro) deacylase)